MATLLNSHVITTSESLGALLLLPFQAIGRALVKLAEKSGRAARLQQLNETSDETLAARGLTRAEAARQIFGSDF